MRRRSKVIFGIVGAVALIAILPILVILPWVASNALAAGYYFVFTTKPSQQELAGQYNVALNWGTADLIIREDGTFQETIRDKRSGYQTTNGHWSSESTDAGHGSAVTMQPYLEVQDDEHGRTFSYATLNFYKPRFGAIFGELNPDTGSRFTKQQN